MKLLLSWSTIRCVEKRCTEHRCPVATGNTLCMVEPNLWVLSIQIAWCNTSDNYSFEVAPRQDPWRNIIKRDKPLCWVRTDQHLIISFPRRGLFILRFLDCSTCSLVDGYRRLYPTRQFPPTKHVRPESELKLTINTCEVIFPRLYAYRQSCARQEKKISGVREEFCTIYSVQHIKGKKCTEHMTRMTVGRIKWKILLDNRVQEGWQRDNVKKIFVYLTTSRLV